MIRHQVTAPLVLAVADNKVHYLYQNDFVPFGVDQARLDDWVNQGLVAEVDGPDAVAPDALSQAAAELGLTPEQAADLLRQHAPAPVEGDENGDGQITVADTAALPADAPKRSASKAVWLEYSIQQGMNPADAENASRDDLIAAAAARFAGQA